MSADTPLHQRLTTLLTADQPRMAALRSVAALGLPDGWIGARWHDDRLEILAPYGLHDLFAGLLRPTPGRDAAFAARIRAKPWLRDWPGLRVSAPGC